MLMFGQFANLEITIPGLIVDSNFRIVSDLSKNIPNEDYYVFAITSNDELNALLSGNYVMTEYFWIGGWYEYLYLYSDYFLGQYGMYKDIIGYTVEDKNDSNRQTEYIFGNSNFNDGKNLAETIKKSDDVTYTKSNYTDIYENSEYKVYIEYALFYKGKPTMYRLGYGENVEYFYNSLGLPALYYEVGKIREHIPLGCRDKVTKEEIEYSDLLQMVDDARAEDAMFDVDNFYRQYEYYYEEKLFIFEDGHALTN